jgi:hypothetical protein
MRHCSLNTNEFGQCIKNNNIGLINRRHLLRSWIGRLELFCSSNLIFCNIKIIYLGTLENKSKYRCILSEKMQINRKQKNALVGSRGIICLANILFILNISVASVPKMILSSSLQSK